MSKKTKQKNSSSRLVYIHAPKFAMSCLLIKSKRVRFNHRATEAHEMHIPDSYISRSYIAEISKDLYYIYFQ